MCSDSGSPKNESPKWEFSGCLSAVFTKDSLAVQAHRRGQFGDSIKLSQFTEFQALPDSFTACTAGSTLN